MFLVESGARRSRWRSARQAGRGDRGPSAATRRWPSGDRAGPTDPPEADGGPGRCDGRSHLDLAEDSQEAVRAFVGSGLRRAIRRAAGSRSEPRSTIHSGRRQSWVRVPHPQLRFSADNVSGLDLSVGVLPMRRPDGPDFAQLGPGRANARRSLEPPGVRSASLLSSTLHDLTRPGSYCGPAGGRRTVFDRSWFADPGWPFEPARSLRVARGDVQSHGQMAVKRSRRPGLRSGAWPLSW